MSQVAGDVDVDVAVVGAGLMGAATAWALCRAGRSVALVEQWEPGHRHGSSHGSSRIFRRAYADDFYVGLTGRAQELWREAELDTGTPLLRLTGGLDHGPGRDPESLHAALRSAGVACTLLDAGAAAERWPGMRFDGPVLHHPDAGVVDADVVVRALVDRAAQLGAQLLTGTRVLAVEQAGDRVTVRTDGRTVRADSAVVAAGAWLPELAVPVDLPPLTVTQQQVVHLRQHDASAAWPTFVHKEELQIYGLPSGTDGGAGPAVKIGQHDGGAATTAATRDGIVDPAARERLLRYASAWLPGVDPEPVHQVTCLYTSTDDEDFVLDRVGQVVIASPCSGHGAKFAPLIGELAADLALGRAEPMPRFALRRPALR